MLGRYSALGVWPNDAGESSTASSQAETEELIAEWLADPNDDYFRRCPECGAGSDQGEMCGVCVDIMFPGMF